MTSKEKKCRELKNEVYDDPNDFIKKFKKCMGNDANFTTKIKINIAPIGDKGSKGTKGILNENGSVEKNWSFRIG